MAPQQPIEWSEEVELIAFFEVLHVEPIGIQVWIASVIKFSLIIWNIQTENYYTGLVTDKHTPPPTRKHTPGLQPRRSTVYMLRL